MNGSMGKSWVEMDCRDGPRGKRRVEMGYRGRPRLKRCVDKGYRDGSLDKSTCSTIMSSNLNMHGKSWVWRHMPVIPVL